MNELMILQQIQARLIRIECCLDYLCKKSSDSTVLLNQILNDVATANGNIDTANVGQGGVNDANTAISNIDCGSCDLTEVNTKLDEIIENIPSMKCKYKKNDEEISSKTTKAKRYDD